MDYSELHASISNAERIQLIRDYPVVRVVCAPGHRTLRNPASIERISQAIRDGRLKELSAEPILLGIFTEVKKGKVLMRAVECLDGHHRLLGGLRAGVWRVVGDIPDALLDTRVNGWRANGTHAEPRWIPLEVAQRSRLPSRCALLMQAEWAKVKP